jgi:transposase-like protein
MAELAHVGDFCPNKQCTEYGKVQTTEQRNIIKYGFARSGHQRYYCERCKKSFVETIGTIFYGRRTPDAEILNALAHIAEGSRISSLTRITGHKEDTILEWLRAAGKHAEELEDVLLSDYQISRGQIDGLWAFVENKGEKKAILKQKKVDSFGAQPC